MSVCVYNELICVCVFFNTILWNKFIWLIDSNLCWWASFVSLNVYNSVHSAQCHNRPALLCNKEKKKKKENKLHAFALKSRSEHAYVHDKQFHFELNNHKTGKIAIKLIKPKRKTIDFLIKWFSVERISEFSTSIFGGLFWMEKKDPNFQILTLFFYKKNTASTQNPI